MTSERIALLRQKMAEQNLPALLVTQTLNRRYVSGFSGSAGILFITEDKALLLTDFRYVERAAEEAPDCEIMEVDGSLAPMLPDLMSEAGADKVGFESAYVPYAEYKAWRGKIGASALSPVLGLVEGLRSVKSQEEAALIRQAVRISDGAYGHLKEYLRPGMTEKQVAWELEVWMRTHGADDIAFDIIVASGPNGARPHALASDREIGEGEPITVDMGAAVRGYNSDLTRTFCLGHADDQFCKVFDITLRAQEAAERFIKPGVAGKDADAVARDIIKAAGHGEQFGHGLGHGVGMAVHESPGMGPKAVAALAPGNIVTVEPGIYIAGWGGVRIEDMVLVTESGVEVLTQAAKDRVIPVK